MSTYYKTKIFLLKGLGSPKVFLFCINIGEFRCRRDFFPKQFLRDIVRRTTSFCNKELQVSAGESWVECFKCCAMDQLNVNYFIFTLCPLTVRSF